MKASYKLPFFLFYLFVFFGFIFETPSLFAAQTSSVKIEPGVIEKKADPGTEYSTVLHATNTGIVPETYYVVVQNIDSIDAEGRPIFAKKTETTGFELSSWIKIPQTTFVVQPQATVDIPFAVVIPKDATPGGHFGAIFVSTEGKKPETIGAAVGYEVGALLSFQISGEVLEQAEIRQFTSDQTIYGKTKVNFKLKVKNTGNSLARPRGVIEIVDMFGKNVTTIKLNDSASAVFPHAEREFTASWEDDRVHMGKYAALASMTYGFDVQHTMYAQTDFWIAPTNVITPVLGFLFFVALILYITVKLYIRKKMKEYGISAKSSKKADFSSSSTMTFLFFIIFTAVFLLALFAMLA